MWTIAEAAARVGGRILETDAPFLSVGTDSRRDCSGQLFVALRGEHFDGHDFVAQARERGAAAAMVDHPLPLPISQWVVEDTRLALGRLAAAWRDRFAGKVIAVTGSNGKTTCKEMMAAVLGQVGTVRATAGNLNNDIGMPLTMLAARNEDFLVLEMGANHAGEIGYLSGIGRPDIAVITSVGRAHLEGFGSLEGVARAKGEIATGLAQDGTFIVPAASPWADIWRDIASERRIITFGQDASADVRADAEEVTCVWDEQGFRTEFNVRAWAGAAAADRDFALGLAGMHNVRNALAAIAVADLLGVGAEAVLQGLAGLQPVKGRLNARQGARGVRVIDDTYNANPDSVQAAIDVLVRLPGRHWLVLGDLSELGPEAEAFHRDLGDAAREAGVDRLFTVGKHSARAAEAFGESAEHFPDHAPLIAALRQQLGAGDLVLVKGSRLSAMERVADALCGEGEP